MNLKKGNRNDHKGECKLIFSIKMYIILVTIKNHKNIV